MALLRAHITDGTSALLHSDNSLPVPISIEPSHLVDGFSADRRNMTECCQSGGGNTSEEEGALTDRTADDRRPDDHHLPESIAAVEDIVIMNGDIKRAVVLLNNKLYCFK